MNGQASFTLRGRNPDVLTCIANLSNDEVFTPPEFANPVRALRQQEHQQRCPLVGDPVECLTSGAQGIENVIPWRLFHTSHGYPKVPS